MVEITPPQEAAAGAGQTVGCCRVELGADFDAGGQAGTVVGLP